MITSFKIFENNKEPQVGDYVVCDDKNDGELNKFIINNIGEITELNWNKKDDYFEKYFLIKYNNIPNNLNTYFFSNQRFFSKNDIKFYSKNKKNVEVYLKQYLKAKKYNI
jgi:hypothetical protein